MAGSLSSWPALLRNAYAKTQPGGWVEVHDFDTLYRSDDGSLPPTAHIHKFVAALVEGCDKMGKEVLPGPKIEGWVKDAGFVNVSVRTYKVPLGPWPRDARMKEVGLLNLMQVIEGLEAFSYRLFTGVLGWELGEVQVLNAKVKEEIKGRAHHAYYVLWVLLFLCLLSCVEGVVLLTLGLVGMSCVDRSPRRVRVIRSGALGVSGQQYELISTNYVIFVMDVTPSASQSYA